MVERVHERRRMRARRSLSLSNMGQFKREDLEQSFKSLVTRSYSPARVLVRSASVKYLKYDPDEKLKAALAPRYSNNPFSCFVVHDIEDQPLRKYDVYSLQTWSYPLWKYINAPPTHYSPYRTHYTPPLMSGGYERSHKSYSGYSYLASDHSFEIAQRRRPADNYNLWRWKTNQKPWYYGYFGHAGLRHFGGFRPRYISHRLTPYW